MNLPVTAVRNLTRNCYLRGSFFLPCRTLWSSGNALASSPGNEARSGRSAAGSLSHITLPPLTASKPKPKPFDRIKSNTGRPRPSASAPSVDAVPQDHDDPDTFGTLSIGNTGLAINDEIGIVASHGIRSIANEVESIYTPEEADDVIFKPDHPWTMDRLQREVFQLLRDKKLKQALDTFTEVVQDGGFEIIGKELSFICGVLMHACAKAGHVEMAFKLFEDMKRRGLRIKEAWYTSLFNACANSPWDSERNLNRIEKLRMNMSYKGYMPNKTHYHAMIKAYGRCGAIESAFSIVDEIGDSDSEEKIPITTETFNFLFQSCITDQENGYRHAVATWQKMMKMKIKPDVYSYKLFLRAIRECSIKLPTGKEETRMISRNRTAGTVINTTPEILDSSPGLMKNNIGMVELITMNENESLRIESRERFPLIQKTNSELQLLMNVPENRFALLGGLRAFTIQLDIHKVDLDLQIATELAQNVSPNEIPDILMLVGAKKLKPDIHFFNMLMKKYMRWRLVRRAKEIVELLGNYNLNPNIMTWGILALGAERWTDADKLLREMDALGMGPNDEILGGFLLNALRNYDPMYIVRLLEEHVRRDMKPDAYFVARVEKFQDYVHKAILDVECGREVKPFRLKGIVQTKEFNEYWLKLKLRFDSWVKQVGVKEKEVPWKADKAARMESLNNRKYQPSLDPY